MRTEIGALEEAFVARFSDHHGFLLAKMLAQVDAINADIADVDAPIQAEITPFAQAATRLDEIPGIGRIAAHVIISEIGLDMSRFPTPGHLASWVRFAPGIRNPPAARKAPAPPASATAT